MVSRLKDTLLLVGDAKSDRAELSVLFGSVYDLLEAENVPQAAMLLHQNIDCVAAVLADLPLSHSMNLRPLTEACRSGAADAVPLILLADESGGAQEELAFALGADDVITRPYTPTVILRRVQVLVDLNLHKWRLQKLVEEQNLTIRNTNQVMLDALSALIEHRSTESGNHVLRIRRFTKILLDDVARSCPEYGLDERIIDLIAGASALHDIGKISIPDRILNKPDRLTEEEIAVMRTHTTVGGQLVLNLDGMGETDFLRYAYNIALYHHERWDGGGYPCGLKGEDIPICAQVVSIADVFDALTTPRVYKPAYSYKTAVNMILNGECGAFSPKLLECFKHVRGEFAALAHQYADGYSPKNDDISLPLPGPSWKSNPLDTAQLSLVKYQALLHHIDDTVLELDLDSGLFHVVYNPDPDLDTILPSAEFHSVEDLFSQVELHPEDSGVAGEIRAFLEEEFFQLNLRRRTFSCRLFSGVFGEWRPYEITFLRVNTGNEEQHVVISLWHRLERPLPGHSTLPREDLHASPALRGLVSSALRCLCDGELTIDAGEQALQQLTGYTAEEIRRDFGGKLLRLVDPADRERFALAMKNHMEQGGRGENEFRLLRKDQPSLWVLDRSRVYIEADGQEYVYHAIRDNARIKAAEHALEATIERNQTILEQSGGIIFEWDLTSDTMYCSPKWKEHFGYEPASKNYGAQMGLATHFHPDDLSIVRSAIEEIRAHNDTLTFDVRIADANARYLWTRVVATAYLDEHGALTRIIGVLQDIDTLKRAELALREQAERDALTGLLNKASSQRLITAALAEREGGNLSALLMLDLDNFKLINDTYGHLYGDAVLSQVGATLRKMFRAHDIVGRIGGDEFLILLRDIPGEDLVHARCRLLLETVRGIMEETAPGLNVSCSIGVALVPAHGKDYTDLFRHADEALYRSKALGKDTYLIYDPTALTPALSGAERVATRIDSDEQPGMADASFVRFVFRLLYESDDILKTIHEILAYVGQQLNVSRVYIFENNEDDTTCSNTFEWCNTDITPEIDNLQNVSYIDDIAGWQNVFDEQGVFYCPDIHALQPHFRAILEPQNIKSMLQCSLRDGGRFRGYMGFDECSVNRLWTQEQINLLQFLAEMMSLFLLKQRARDNALHQAEGMQAILDRQNDWIYVVDPDTCRVRFLNEKTRKLAPDSRVGDVCYEAFMKRTSRCENCPMSRVHTEQCPTSIIENPNFHLRVLASAEPFVWNGTAGCLVTCKELPAE